MSTAFNLNHNTKIIIESDCGFIEEQSIKQEIEGFYEGVEIAKLESRIKELEEKLASIQDLSQ